MIKPEESDKKAWNQFEKHHLTPEQKCLQQNTRRLRQLCCCWASVTITQQVSEFGCIQVLTAWQKLCTLAWVREHTRWTFRGQPVENWYQRHRRASWCMGDATQPYWSVQLGFSFPSQRGVRMKRCHLRVPGSNVTVICSCCAIPAAFPLLPSSLLPSVWHFYNKKYNLTVSFWQEMLQPCALRQRSNRAFCPKA